MVFKRCSCAGNCKHPWSYVFEVNGRRYSRSSKTTNKQAAERIELKRRNAVVEGKDDEIAPAQLFALVREYIKAAKAEHTTADKTERTLNAFKNAIGDKLITDVSAFHIEKWRLARAKEVKQVTVNRELTILRGFFSRVIVWKKLASSPLTGLKDYDVDDTRIRVLTDAELALAMNSPDVTAALLCRATLVSLARISELLGLRVEHIGPAWMELRRKGGAVERVAIDDDLRTRLLAHATKGKVFHFTQQAATNRVRRAFAAAGIRGASHHTCRHTGVTLMLEDGVNPRVIQKLAGWSSLRMLERYGHARDAETRRAISVVAEHIATTLATTVPEEQKAGSAVSG